MIEIFPSHFIKNHVSVEGCKYSANRTLLIAALAEGISAGKDIFLRIAFKPTPSIGEIAYRGRHDSCVVFRAVPIVEAMVSIVLCDHYLMNLKNKYIF